MQTEAIVVSVEKNRATVQINRKSACDGCHKSTDENGCSVCSLLGANSTFSSVADNRIGARVGDRVLVETETGRVLFYAAIVFLLPVFLALLFWGIAACFTEDALWQAISAAFGFVGSFVGIWIYSERFKKKKQDIVIVSILNASE